MELQIEQSLKEYIASLDTKRERAIAMLETFETAMDTDVNKTERYRNLIRKLVRQPKAFHITDLEEEFRNRGFDFSKAIVHQCLHTLRESEEVLGIKINNSNQKCYYMAWSAQDGGKFKVKEEYLPIRAEFIESVEIM